MKGAEENESDEFLGKSDVAVMSEDEGASGAILEA